VLFRMVLYISVMAEASVVKYCTQAGYTKCLSWYDNPSPKGRGQSCEILGSIISFERVNLGTSNFACRLILTSNSAFMI